MSASGEITKSGIVGGILGGFLSILVGASLAEISVSSTFSLMFGLCLICIGAILIVRVYTSDLIESWKRRVTLVFALKILISGLTCFLLDEDWFNDFTVQEKVPLYCILSMSLSFVMSYVLLEYINLGLCKSCCQSHSSRGYIQDKPETLLYFGLVLLMGFIFGLSFGLTDSEDDETQFRKQQRATIPVGIIGGMSIGSVVEYLHQNQGEEATPHYENTLHVDIDDNF
eukprot:TRINITY_DN18770_c0_g1_i1.p1 TRINITY_DN18770_c0_g1~~TRINITY_DN18770_c0_g1_i1.p1  ORF type:complete len:228 (+),score=41.28 TRINITY_DN18770_c0_g1_i1:48-731(+)